MTLPRRYVLKNGSFRRNYGKNWVFFRTNMMVPFWGTLHLLFLFRSCGSAVPATFNDSTSTRKYMMASALAKVLRIVNNMDSRLYERLGNKFWENT